MHVPKADFELDLVPGSVTSTMKELGGSPAMGGAGALYMVPPSAIREIEGFNVRVDTPDYLTHIETLKASIKTEGFYRDKPLDGYVQKEEAGTVLYLTGGYSRYRAVRELADEGHVVEAVPFIVKPAGQSLEDLTVALVQGNEGRPLSIYERAIVAKRLKGMGVEDARISERLNITSRYLADLLLLAGAPVSVRNLVIRGKVSGTEAVKQLRSSGKGAAEKITAGVKDAEAKGKAKATGKDVNKPGKGALVEKSEVKAKSKEKGDRVTTTINYAFKAGDIVEAAQIAAVKLFDDADWWVWNDDSTRTHAVIESDITIDVTITRTKTDDTFDTPDEPETGQLEDLSGESDAVEADETQTDEDSGL